MLKESSAVLEDKCCDKRCDTYPERSTRSDVGSIKIASLMSRIKYMILVGGEKGCTGEEHHRHQPDCGFKEQRLESWTLRCRHNRLGPAKAAGN